MAFISSVSGVGLIRNPKVTLNEKELCFLILKRRAT
jgi:hypothetical protein